MTERLYYHDSFLREFDAQVISCNASGERWQAVLDRTAFYPTSGGQPHDTGRLGEAAVLEVSDREDGAVVHLTDRQLAPGSIHGVIDWLRRFDHMQQHTGQHLLSAAFIELFGFATVSFHLGREVSTIDLAAPGVSAAQLAEAERRTNEIIFDDREIRVLYGSAEELAAAGIRKQVDREGVLRAVEVEGFDRQPCGGTHVRRTGQVGAILLRRCEKMKQNWRVEFVCGGRAVRAARHDLETLVETSRLLSCGPEELPAMVSRAIEERQEGYRTRQRLQEQLAEVEAMMLLTTEARAGKPGEPRVVLHVFDSADADYLRLLASKLVAEPRVQALLGTRLGGHLVFAQTPGLPADMNALLRESLAPVGGKGGGTRDFAQGKIPDPATIENLLRSALPRFRG
jgi:alanyl-tRNA synthetase